MSEHKKSSGLSVPSIPKGDSTPNINNYRKFKNPDSINLPIESGIDNAEEKSEVLVIACPKSK